MGIVTVILDDRIIDGATLENALRTARTVHRRRSEQASALYHGI